MDLYLSMAPRSGNEHEFRKDRMETREQVRRLHYGCDDHLNLGRNRKDGEAY